MAKCLEAICCQDSVFQPVVEVKTRLRLAKLLLDHCENPKVAQSLLERAVRFPYSVSHHSYFTTPHHFSRKYDPRTLWEGTLGNQKRKLSTVLTSGWAKRLSWIAKIINEKKKKKKCSNAICITIYVTICNKI